MRASVAVALEQGGWEVRKHLEGGWVAIRGGQAAWGQSETELLHRVMELERVIKRGDREGGTLA